MQRAIFAVLTICLLSANAIAKDPEPYLKAAGMPFYPQLARVARIQGEVELSFEVNETGEPENVEAFSGAPMLKAAALEVVKSWKFSPCSCRTKKEVTFTYKISEEIHKRPRRVTVTWFDNEHILIEADPIPMPCDHCP